MKKFVLILFIAVTGINQAQMVKTVHAEYIYYMSETESRKEARIKAIEEARAQALRKVFGESVTQTSGHVNEKMTVFGNMEVNGKWLKDTKDPVIRYRIDSITGETGIFVQVWGKVQEIKRQEADLEIATKCCTEDGHCLQTETFKDGDLLNFDFRSPEDGFLAVYLEDEDHNMFRLLPLVLNPKGIQEVRANTFYESMLPSLENAYIELRAYNTDEVNLLHFVFSPNPFSIPLDEDVGGGLRLLEYQVFQEWISKNRTRDAEMQDKKIMLTIRK